MTSGRRCRARRDACRRQHRKRHQRRGARGHLLGRRTAEQHGETVFEQRRCFLGHGEVTAQRLDVLLLAEHVDPGDQTALEALARELARALGQGALLEQELVLGMARDQLVPGGRDLGGERERCAAEIHLAGPGLEQGGVARGVDTAP